MTRSIILKGLGRSVCGVALLTVLHACGPGPSGLSEALLPTLSQGAGADGSNTNLETEFFAQPEARNEDGTLKYRNYYVRLAENVAPPEFKEGRWVFEKDRPGLTELFAQHGVRAFRPAFPGVSDPVLDRTYGVEIEFEDEALAAVLQEQYRELFPVVEAVPIMWPLYTPNDYFSPIMAAPDSNWHLNITKATSAWAITQGDPNIVIGILEPSGTRFDTAHEDLQGEFRSVHYSWGAAGGGYHGTAVAHVASGNTNNGKGLASMGFRTKLAGFAYRSMAGWSDIGLLFELVKQGTRIINMSFYFGDSAGRPVVSQTGLAVILTLHNLDTIMIAGAGNDGYPDDLHYPASWGEVISVTSIGVDGSHYNSNGGFTHAHNTYVDLTAPGYSVPIVQPNNTYASWGTGTSLAAPMVSGAAALMLSVNPCLSADDVKQLLRSTTQPIVNLLPSNAPYAGKLGTGLLDAHAAVSAAANHTSTTFTPPLLKPGFTYEIQCDANLNARLFVTGENNPGLTHQQYNLYNQVTNQLLEVKGFPATSANLYAAGPHRIDEVLDPQKRYYVKHGLWDSCQPWREARVYDIHVTVSCVDQQNYALNPTYRTHAANPHNINGFAVSGDNSGAIDRIEFSIRATATSTPINSVRQSPALPVTVSWPGLAAGAPYSVEAVLFFTNGQTKVLTWM
ncbi:MAG: S8/S53 family peptidase [Leptospirales bacterium]